MDILTVKNLCKNEILKDISFTVKSGEMVAVMGPSGSGKSTLLYQVSGMDRATSGEIFLGEKDISKLSEDELADMRLRKMGFVFQQMNMLKNLDIMDNILLPAYQISKSKDEKAKAKLRASALMEKLGVGDLAHRKITEVSGGQLQRACICRSMMNKPEILFADEPTGALNGSASAEVLAELLKLGREGTTILMVTHDSKVASRCDRILYLMDGSIKGELSIDGSTDDKSREKKVSEWLGKMGW